MYRITQCLSVGPFASPDRAEALAAAGVTHVLNVADSPGELASTTTPFREVVWAPLDAFRVIPEDAARHTLDLLHRMAAEPGAHVYVHCAAGQLRSPTVLWLYLIACGYDADSARDIIEERSPVAEPGHYKLVGPGLVLAVQMHGLAHYFPHPRGEVLVPYGEPIDR